MSYLNMLKEQKQAREEYEQDTIDLKKEVLRINDLHTLYDGDFLRELKKFINEYQSNKK